MLYKRDSLILGPDTAWPGPHSQGDLDTSLDVSCSPGWPEGLSPAGGLSH